MTKKNINNEHNLQRSDVKNSIKNNELLNKLFKSGKEERQKIVDGLIVENYRYWVYMRKGLPGDYFVSEKTNVEEDDNEESKNGKIDGKKVFELTNGQFKGKNKSKGINGIITKKKSKSASTVDSNITKRPYPTTLEGLEKEFDELKGKALSYHGNLRKKGLYSRIIKKRRKEERSKLKEGVKNNLSSENKGIKIKPVKRVFNSEGKVVSSKFDFSETEQTKNKNQLPENILINGSSKVNKIITDHGKKRVNTELNENVELKKNKTDNKIKHKVDTQNSDEPKIENVKLESKFEPVFNKESKMVFSRFEFSEEKNKHKKKKAEKDPQKILDKLKEKQANLKQLESSGSKEKALEIKEREKWVAALKKASGEKVKDDPDLLKKSLRKEKHKKLHSKKKWEARVSNVKTSQQEKQQKRTDNIRARKEEKKKKKIKRAVKKGRYVPNL